MVRGNQTMARLVGKHFSKFDLDAIEEAVRKAESSTGGEIVVELHSQSHNWIIERLVYAIVISLVSGFAALYFTTEHNWGTYYDFTQVSLWSMVGFLVAYFGLGQFLKRQTRRQKLVWLHALKSF
jgi:uncharacterized membrane protein